MKAYLSMKMTVVNDAEGRDYTEDFCGMLRKTGVPYKKIADAGYITVEWEVGARETD